MSGAAPPARPVPRSTPRPALLAAALTLTAAGCGDDDSGRADAAGDQLVVMVTTGILGDAVADLVDDRAEVVVLMPAGTDPHNFQLSARQAAELREADALVTNGAGFEAGMLDALDAAEDDGVPTYHAVDAVETLAYGEEGHEDEAHADGATDDDHSDEGTEATEDDHADEAEGEHEHEGADPHFFTDPDRMADAAQGIAAFLAEEIPALDTDAFRTSADDVVSGLHDLASEVDDILAPVPADQRVLVTNHEVFGYFADRFDFEVVGAVIPGGSTQEEGDAGNLEELAHLIEEEGVPAIFGDVSSPGSLAEALASEVGGDVEVVSLYSESLGPEGSEADTYAGMQRTNARLMAEALA